LHLWVGHSRLKIYNEISYKWHSVLALKQIKTNFYLRGNCPLLSKERFELFKVEDFVSQSNKLSPNGIENQAFSIGTI